jgi:two-component system NtrC family response regulator
MKPRIMIVDDEENQRTILSGFLQKSGYDATAFENAKSALNTLEKKSFDLIISDMKMGEISGEEFLEKVKKQNPIIPFIMITAFGNVDHAVRIMQKGATDYISKPVNLKELLIKIEKAIEMKFVVEENITLRNEIVETHLSETIITKSKKMMEILSLAGRAARTDVPVLILGESGTGKELLARTIHCSSPRKEKPFVPVNCASLNSGLLESELFGHEKGAFTGANAKRKGRFEMSEKGTLFLDEVGDIPSETQVKLLRVLQEKEIERVGGSERIKVDFRLVCATNKNLDKLVEENRFREDLLYRINVLTLTLPPLRERKEDLPMLIDHFLKVFANQYGINVKGFSANAMSKLLNYHYPGNIRELKNIIQRAVVLARGETITQLLFDKEEGDGNSFSRPETIFNKPLNQAVEELEKTMILQALEESNFVQVKAAEKLGLTERNLRYKMDKYGLKNIKNS